MIFNKKVYSPSNFSLSFLKRLRLVSFLRFQANIDYSESIRVVPKCSETKNLNDISLLNDLCHVEAFIEKDSKVHVDLSLCNSCGDCSRVSGFNIEMISLKKSEMSIKDLALNRDD